VCGPFLHGNARETHLWWVAHDMLIFQKCSCVILTSYGVQEGRGLIIEQDASLLVPKELWQMSLEISVQILMTFGFHEDLHGPQYLRHPLAVVVGPLLLLLLLKGQ